MKNSPATPNTALFQTDAIKEVVTSSLSLPDELTLWGMIILIQEPKKGFLHVTPTSKTIKEQIDLLDCIKIKSFLFFKRPCKQMNRHAANWDKIIHNSHILTTDSYVKLVSTLKTRQEKQTSNPIRKQAKTMEKHLTKEEIQMAHKHMRKIQHH